MFALISLRSDFLPVFLTKYFFILAVDSKTKACDSDFNQIKVLTNAVNSTKSNDPLPVLLAFGLSSGDVDHDND